MVELSSEEGEVFLGTSPSVVVSVLGVVLLLVAAGVVLDSSGCQ